MSWYNPASWFQTKDTSLTLDQAIERIRVIQSTASNISVTPETALQSPTVFAIVSQLSSAIASMPFAVHQDRSAGGRRRTEKLDQHPVTRLLHTKPNPYQTRYEYWTQVIVQLVLRGSFYARKLQPANGRITGLLPLAGGSVQERLVTPSLKLEFVVADERAQGTHRQQAMHWIKKLTVDGMEPITPVSKCREAIALEIAAEKFGGQIFGHGAIPNVVIKHPGHFADDEAAKRFRDSWNKAFGGGRRGTAVLEDGIDIEQMQLNAEESQFLETRKFQRSVIAGAFGVPPHIIGDLERATFSNIEQMSLNYVIHALTPYLECIEAAIDRDLLSDADRQAGMYARFDTNQMLRGDMKSRAEALRILREWGIINANEWREMEGWDAREDEGGDDYLSPLNYRRTDESGNDDGGDERSGPLGIVRESSGG